MPTPLMTSREAIADSMYRAVFGIDSNNLPLFDSALVGEEASFHFTGGASFNSLSAIHQALDPIAAMDTTHIISNVRVTIDEGDENSARITATSVAQHYPAGRGMELGAPHLLAGGLYDISVVKVRCAEGSEPEWRIKRWELRTIWQQGDPSVMPQHK